MVDPLFTDTPLGTALDVQRRKSAAAIAELSSDVLRDRGLDDLEAELVERYRLDPLVLNWDAKTVGSREVEVHVGGDENRGISGPSQLVTVTGTEITFFVGYSGARGLFDMRPSTHTGNPPRGFVRGEDLLISYSGVDADLVTVKRELAREESAVKKWVSLVNREVVAFNGVLQREIHAALKARIDKVRADADLETALGVPVHQRPPRRREGIEASDNEPPTATRHESVPGPRRGPGRPGWTRGLFEERWGEAQAATREPRTFQAMAANFKALDGIIGGVDGDHLRRLRRKRFPE